MQRHATACALMSPSWALIVWLHLNITQASLGRDRPFKKSSAGWFMPHPDTLSPRATRTRQHLSRAGQPRIRRSRIVVCKLVCKLLRIKKQPFQLYYSAHHVEGITTFYRDVDVILKNGRSETEQWHTQALLNLAWNGDIDWHVLGDLHEATISCSRMRSLQSKYS